MAEEPRSGVWGRWVLMRNLRGSWTPPSWALSLGDDFSRAFASRTRNGLKGEVALFRAMQGALVAIAQPPRVVVEEYHGGGHQVRFRGTGTYARTNARCELSDLMVIVFARRSKDARLSYIQAKSERKVAASSGGIAGSALSANLEQWHLLATHPAISGVGGFDPPHDLLSSALLPSVGSFAFFLHAKSGVDIYYAAASQLDLPFQYSTRSGRLVAQSEVCRGSPLPECLSAYGNDRFGAFLFGLMIGTPIACRGRPCAPGGGWLAAQLRGVAHQNGENASTELASTLADILDPDSTSRALNPNVGAASLVLIGINSVDGRWD